MKCLIRLFILEMVSLESLDCFVFRKPEFVKNGGRVSVALFTALPKLTVILRDNGVQRVGDDQAVYGLIQGPVHIAPE